MKICLIGNSHLVALRAGWDTIKDDHPDISADFFAIARSGFRNAELDGTTLIPTRPRQRAQMAEFSGADSIDLSAYDAFAFVGFVIGLPRVLRYLQGHGIAGEIEDTPQIVPYAMLQDAWDEQLSTTALPRLTELVRQVSDAPIVNLVRPMRSALILDEDSTRAAFYSQEVDRDGLPYANTLVDRLMAPHHAAGMVTLAQPHETTVKGLLTRKRYSDAPERLPDGNPPKGGVEVNHMNAAFGADCMVHILDALVPAPVVEEAG